MAKTNFHKISNMVKLTDPVKYINSYSEYYAYEVLSEEDILQTAPGALEGVGQEEKKEPEKDENGFFIGQKCQCRWKSMNGAYYNCEIGSRNEDGTYVIDYEDGDKDPSVEMKRLKGDPWIVEQPKYKAYYDQLGEGFHNDSEEGRITVQLLHRVGKTTST